MAQNDYSAHKAQGMGLSFAMIALATSSAILRFIARKRSKAGIGLNDWIILPALLSLYGFAVTIIWESAKGAFGLGPEDLTPPLLVVLGKAFYIAPIFSIPTISFVKFSILCLYHKVFASRAFRTWLFIVGVTVVLWFIVCQLIVVLHCIPPKTLWDPRVAGKCLNFTLFFKIAESINCAQELIIALMPIGVIRRLHLDRSQKLSLALIFSLGIFVAMIGFIRIALICDPNASPDAVHVQNKWLLGQLDTAIVCANSLTYRPLVPKNGILPNQVSDWYKSLVSLGGVNRSSKKGYINSENDGRRWSSRYERFNDRGTDGKHVTQAANKQSKRSGNESVALQTIDKFSHGEEV